MIHSYGEAGARGCGELTSGQGKTRFRRLDRVGFAFTFTATAYNLIRLPKLLEAPA